jgi:hypothetical protein
MPPLLVEGRFMDLPSQFISSSRQLFFGRITDDDDEDDDDIVVVMECRDEWDSLWRFRSIVVVPSSSSLSSSSDNRRRWTVVVVSCLSRCHCRCCLYRCCYLWYHIVYLVWATLKSIASSAILDL